MKRLLTTVPSLICGWLLMAVLVSSCQTEAADKAKSKAKQEEVEETPTLPVVEVETRDIELSQELVADIRAVQNVEIRARVDGFLDKILVDEGKRVSKGQRLFSLSDEEYVVAQAKAEADLSGAKAETIQEEVNLERVEGLVEKKVVTKSELKLAKARLLAAKAKVDAAQSELERVKILLKYTHINSPFDGIVDLLPLKRGSLIKEGTHLTTISDISAVFAYFYLSEKQYLQFAKGGGSKDLKDRGHVELILADGTDYPFQGVVETMQGEFQEETGTLSFRARFPNPQNLLKHGSTGKIRLSTTVDGALLIPQKSTFEIQDKNFVYVLDSANTVRTRAIVPSARYKGYYVVSKGLKAGEKLVYEGLQSIREGDKIIPRPTKHKPTTAEEQA